MPEVDKRQCLVQSSSGRVDDDVETLICGREDEVAHELIVHCFVNNVLMLAAVISFPQPLLTDGVRKSFATSASVINDRIQVRQRTVFAGNRGRLKGLDAEFRRHVVPLQRAVAQIEG
jgi:hypothetical protein